MLMVANWRSAGVDDLGGSQVERGTLEAVGIVGRDVQALNSSTDGDDVAVLVKVLQADESALVREEAASTLGHLLGRYHYGFEPTEPQVSPEGHESAVRALGAVLKADKAQAVRNSCARALGVIAAVESVADLETAVARDPATIVRQSAIRAIAALPAEESVASFVRLVRVLAPEGDQDANMYALNGIAMTLGEMGEAPVSQLLPLLESGEWRVRRYVAEALGGTGSERARGPLKILQSSDPQTEVRDWAGLALKQLDSKPSEGSN